MKSTNKTDSEKLLYKLILQFSIFTRGSNELLDPHLVNISKNLKLGLNYQELTSDLLALSKTLTHISSTDNQAKKNDSPSSILQLQKDFINRLNTLLSETNIPLKFKGQYTQLKQKCRLKLDSHDSKKVIDLALSLLIDIKDYAISQQQEIETFLKDISKKLSVLEKQTLIASKSNELSIENSENLSNAINHQVDNIKNSTAEAKKLSMLQENINLHLQELTFQLLKHQKIETDRNLESNHQLKQMSLQLKEMEIEVESLRNNLKIARGTALIDKLTRLPNRMAYDERISLEFNRWRRYNSPLTLIIWDIDLFKQINDNFGHKAGDNTLTLVAQLISNNCRETDFTARFGGEEFVTLLPNTNSEQAFELAEKIRSIIASSGFNHHGKSIKLTISCGISQFSEGDECGEVFDRADQALYLSKEQGRNKCSVVNKS